MQSSAGRDFAVTTGKEGKVLSARAQGAPPRQGPFTVYVHKGRKDHSPFSGAEASPRCAALAGAVAVRSRQRRRAGAVLPPASSTPHYYPFWVHMFVGRARATAGHGGGAGMRGRTGRAGQIETTQISFQRDSNQHSRSSTIGGRGTGWEGRGGGLTRPLWALLCDSIADARRRAANRFDPSLPVTRLSCIVVSPPCDTP